MQLHAEYLSFVRPQCLSIMCPSLVNLRTVRPHVAFGGRFSRPRVLMSSLPADRGVLDRINIAGLSPSHIHEILDSSRPVILEGVLSGRACEAWCDAMMEDLGGASVNYQVRNNSNGRSRVFASDLAEFVEGLQEESSHDESW